MRLVLYDHPVRLCQVKIQYPNAIPAYQLSQTDAFYVLAQEPIGAFGDGATSRMLCSVLDDLGKQGRTRARASRFRRMRRIHRYFLWRQR